MGTNIVRFDTKTDSPEASGQIDKLGKSKLGLEPIDVEDLTPEELQHQIDITRLFDAEGKDSAYEAGLTDQFHPAPKGGRKELGE